jgi:hypothetical protein
MNNLKTLNEIYLNYNSPDGHGDKGTAHTYIDIYEKLLTPYRYNSNVLEIGICTGESIKMWEEYFIDSNIYGVDITTNNYIYEDLHQNPKMIISDATKPEFLDRIGDLKFDVIIDDGSHYLPDQVNSFNLLKNRMNKNGIYIIEDIVALELYESTFKSLHNNIEIIDNRKIKNRQDDVLVIYRF